MRQPERNGYGGVTVLLKEHEGYANTTRNDEFVPPNHKNTGEANYIPSTAAFQLIDANAVEVDDRKKNKMEILDWQAFINFTAVLFRRGRLKV
ncbi:unnamed protein product [Nippostrongylus brasiliensis]|uniref:Uncharacterized protein n=1 Tax=Nippostrongylus brasiliensis TaxID=27835 RepID=A0A0N4YSB7_NIPBR|nr:unnamed protein product [Nippostrongylus brasiliensis]